MTALYCALCHAVVPEGADECVASTAGRTGSRMNGIPCRSHAFYRGRPPQRHIMPRAIEEPEPVAEEPVGARATNAGRMRRMIRQGWTR